MLSNLENPVNLTTAVLFAVVAAVLLTFFALAVVMGPLVPVDSRSIFVLAVGVTGVAFAALSFRRFRALERVPLQRA